MTRLTQPVAADGPAALPALVPMDGSHAPAWETNPGYSSDQSAPPERCKLRFHTMDRGNNQ